MNFALTDPIERANVIAYLFTFSSKDQPGGAPSIATPFATNSAPSATAPSSTPQ